jgi:membrane associated rhomboid family serine protease
MTGPATPVKVDGNAPRSWWGLLTLSTVGAFLSSLGGWTPAVAAFAFVAGFAAGLTAFATVYVEREP